MSVTTEIERIKTNIANAYTELKNKNATIPSVENSEGLPGAIASITTGGGTPITKGLIINEFDSAGLPIDAELVGMTGVPSYYFYCFKGAADSYKPFFKRLEKLKLSDDITQIGMCSFYCNYALKITELPKNLRSFGTSAFEECSNLALTSLPEGVDNITERCFYNCTKLALTSLPDSVYAVGERTFQNCSNITISKLPNILRLIGQYAFSGCSKITIKEIPEGVTNLQSNSFYGCSGITELTVKGNVTQIGTYVFYNCSNLNKLVFSNITNVPTLSNVNAFTGTTPIQKGTGYIYVPDDLVSSFQSASNWSTIASQIKPISELPTE